MSVRPLLALVAVALVATACRTTTTTTTTVSGTPVLQPAPEPPPMDPVGKWTLALTAQGQPMEVVLDLVRGPDGKFAGTLSSQYFPPIPTTSVTVTGKQMTLTFESPTGGTGTMSMTVDGDVADGEWSMPGDGSKLSGRRAR